MIPELSLKIVFVSIFTPNANSALIDKPEVFSMSAEFAFGVKIETKTIFKDNSGITSIDNYDLSTLEPTIDKLIVDSGKFYNSSSKNNSILNKFSKHTFLASKQTKINNNSTGYNDEEVKIVLAEFETKYKKPLKKLLIEYYRLMYNPEISLDGHLLDKLGFVRCSECKQRGLNKLFEQNDKITAVQEKHERTPQDISNWITLISERHQRFENQLL